MAPPQQVAAVPTGVRRQLWQVPQLKLMQMLLLMLQPLPLRQQAGAANQWLQPTQASAAAAVSVAVATLVLPSLAMGEGGEEM